MTQDEIIDKDEVLKMARHISKVLGSRMCDENGDAHGEELYCMAFDDIVDAVKLVADAAAAKEREACEKAARVAIELHSDPVAAIRARGEA